MPEHHTSDYMRSRNSTKNASILNRAAHMIGPAFDGPGGFHHQWNNEPATLSANNSHAAAYAQISALNSYGAPMTEEQLRHSHSMDFGPVSGHMSQHRLSLPQSNTSHLGYGQFYQHNTGGSPVLQQFQGTSSRDNFGVDQIPSLMQRENIRSTNFELGGGTGLDQGTIGFPSERVWPSTVTVRNSDLLGTRTYQSGGLNETTPRTQIVSQMMPAHFEHGEPVFARQLQYQRQNQYSQQPAFARRSQYQLQNQYSWEPVFAQQSQYPLQLQYSPQNQSFTEQPEYQQQLQYLPQNQAFTEQPQDQQLQYIQQNQTFTQPQYQPQLQYLQQQHQYQLQQQHLQQPRMTLAQQQQYQPQQQDLQHQRQQREQREMGLKRLPEERELQRAEKRRKLTKPNSVTSRNPASPSAAPLTTSTGTTDVELSLARGSSNPVGPSGHSYTGTTGVGSPSAGVYRKGNY